jgi:flagellar hook-length control protein FliK
VAQKDATLTGFIHAAPLSTEALSTITHPTDATSFASAPASLPGATHGVAAQGGASTAASGSANPSGNANSEQQPAYQADAAISNAPGTGKNGATRGPDTPASDSGPAGIFALTSSPGIGNAAAASIVTVNAAAAAGQAATIAASTAALAVPFAAHGAGSATTSAQPSATVPDSLATETAATPSLPTPADAAARGAFVTSAQLGQSGTHSEMRVSLQSDNLGSVELHARVSGDSVGAAITVEKRDAHTMLATELPALQQALSDKQLRVEQITVLHAPMSSASGDAAANQFGGAGQGQTSGRGTQNPVGGGFGATALSGFPFATGFNTDAGEIFDAQGRLSVHA